MPRSGSTSDTPTRCHSLVSPASSATWICSLTSALCSSVSSWAKYRPWRCSVMCLLAAFPISLSLVIGRGRPEHEHHPRPECYLREELFIDHRRHLLRIRG